MWTDSDVGRVMLTCLSNNKSITIGVSESFMLSLNCLGVLIHRIKFRLWSGKSYSVIEIE